MDLTHKRRQITDCLWTHSVCQFVGEAPVITRAICQNRPTQTTQRRRIVRELTGLLDQAVVVVELVPGVAASDRGDQPAQPGREAVEEQRLDLGGLLPHVDALHEDAAVVARVRALVGVVARGHVDLRVRGVIRASAALELSGCAAGHRRAPHLDLIG